MEMATTGVVKVEKVRGKSAATTCFSKYPLKLILPSKVGPSSSDAVWIYALSYGGGIVSGDRISCSISVGDGCTAAMTTQASTKVYKAVGSKCSEQILEAKIGRDALLAVIPDPVTCFATARYSQKQVFLVFPDSNLVIVDWFTSGRYESGEKWEFELYKSVNHILLEEDQPLFIDSAKVEAHTESDARRSKEDDVCAFPPSYLCWRSLYYAITTPASTKTATYCFLQFIWSQGNWHGCPDSCIDHRISIYVLKTPSRCIGTISWSFALFCVWTITHC